MSPRKPAVLRHGDGEQTLREHLIATAARLIDERGTAGLTVRDIAREAQVADGVLYNHFAGKEDLLAQALSAHVRSVIRGAGEPPVAGQGTLEGNLRVHVDRVLQVLSRILPAFAGLLSQPNVLSRFHRIGFHAAGERLPAALIAYLRAEQELGRVDAAASVEAAATVITGACHELILPRLFRPGPPEPVSVPPGFIDDLVNTVLHGIAPASRHARGQRHGDAAERSS
jgi:AcrR family transcriptional regulator